MLVQVCPATGPALHRCQGVAAAACHRHSFLGLPISWTAVGVGYVRVMVRVHRPPYRTLTPRRARQVEVGPLLGRGGYGRVFKGRWKGAVVAVKVVEHSAFGIDADTAAAEERRVARESLLSTSLSHPSAPHAPLSNAWPVAGEGGRGAWRASRRPYPSLHPSVPRVALQPLLHQRARL